MENEGDKRPQKIQYGDPSSHKNALEKFNYDEKAIKEDREFTTEDYLKKHQHKLYEKLYPSIGTMLVTGMWLFFITFFVLVFIVLWHIAGPECYHWVNESNLSKLQTTIFSGSIGAIVSSIAQKAFR